MVPKKAQPLWEALSRLPGSVHTPASPPTQESESQAVPKPLALRKSGIWGLPCPRLVAPPSTLTSMILTSESARFPSSVFTPAPSGLTPAHSPPSAPPSWAKDYTHPITAAPCEQPGSETAPRWNLPDDEPTGSPPAPLLHHFYSYSLSKVGQEQPIKPTARTQIHVSLRSWPFGVTWLS